MILSTVYLNQVLLIAHLRTNFVSSKFVLRCAMLLQPFSAFNLYLILTIILCRRKRVIVLSCSAGLRSRRAFFLWRRLACGRAGSGKVKWCHCFFICFFFLHELLFLLGDFEVARERQAETEFCALYRIFFFTTIILIYFLYLS